MKRLKSILAKNLPLGTSVYYMKHQWVITSKIFSLFDGIRIELSDTGLIEYYPEDRYFLPSVIFIDGNKRFKFSQYNINFRYNLLKP